MISSLFAVGAAVGLSTGQDPSAPEYVDLSVLAKQGVPILIEGSERISIQLGPEREERARDYRYVDVHTRLGGGREEGFRHFVREHLVRNGRIADPPLNGVRATFTNDTQTVELTKFEGAEALRLDTQEGLLAAAHTPGFWMPLPERAEVGGVFDLELARIGPVLFGAKAPESLTARVTLESFDASSSVAKLVGVLTAEQEEDGFTLEYSGDCTLLVDTADDRIASVVLDLEAVVRGPQGVDLAGGSARFEVSTTRGEGAVKALTEPAGRRLRPFEIEPFGLSLEVSKVWDQDPANDASRFRLFATDRGANVLIQFKVLDREGADIEGFLRAMEQEFTEVLGGFEAPAGVTCALGEGRSYSFRRWSEETATWFVSYHEYYALEAYDSMFLEVRLNTPEEHFPGIRKEYEAARETLKASE